MTKGTRNLPSIPDTVEPTKADAQQGRCMTRANGFLSSGMHRPLPKPYPMIFVDSTVRTYHFMNFSKGLRNAKPMSAAGMRKSASSPS